MRLVPSLLLLAACAAPEAPETAEASKETWSSDVGARLDVAGSRIYRTPTGPAAEMPSVGMSARFDRHGAIVKQAGGGTIELALVTAGRRDVELLPSAPPSFGAGAPGLTLPDGTAAPRLEYVRGPLVEWFAGTPEGLQHGWTLDAAPAGTGPLTFGLGLEGELLHLEADSLELVGEAGDVWRYDGLAAWDATGRALPATFVAGLSGLEVQVDDRGAVYPVDVDPVLTSAASTLTGPSLTSAFGYALSSAGDVDSDGYDDVIVGAYLVSGNAGAAYVFHGSPSGLATTATTTLTGPSGAFYCGFNVAGGGDLDGDSYDDVVVACVYSAGSVHVFPGGAVGVSTTADASIGSGSAIRYGYGLAIVPSVDGDAYAELLVGAPANGGSRGRTYVYKGAASGVSTSAATTLDGPSPSSYFGLAIEAAGDINGDGYSDVAIGAPSWSSKLGQASVYYGSATGLSSGSVSTITGTSAKSLGTALAAGDFDDDGYSDLAIGSSQVAGGEVWIYEGGASGLSSTASTTLSDSTSSYFGSVLAAMPDADADGYADLAVGAYGAGTASVFEGSGTGLGSTAAVTLTGTGSTWASALAAADVNADGYTDLAVGNYLDTTTFGQVLVYLGYADDDGDGYLVGGDGTAQDCDDTDEDVSPGAAEVAGNESDEDCDGAILCYEDADADGFVEPTLPTVASADADCDDTGESDGSLPATDCDDSEASAHPGGTEVVGDGIDQDCDGAESCYEDDDDDGEVSPSAALIVSADGDCNDAGEGGPSDPQTDCDDGDPTVFAGAKEVVADGIDQDCSGDDDCYADVDLDGFGSTDTVAASGGDCTKAGSAATATDCDDGDATVNPAGIEECDPLDADENCDGTADDPTATGTSTWFADNDGDGYGDATDTTAACDAPAGFVANATDCDDSDATVTAASLWYTDSDGDGYGLDRTSRAACAGGADEVAVGGDCDDGDSSTSPGSAETAGDGTDQDCDGLDDCYVDGDGDGARSSTTVAGTTLDCSAAGEASAGVASDCDDTDATAFPGGSEGLADDVDGDCDGAELCYADSDDDGYGTATSVSSADLSCDDTGEAATDGSDCDDSDGSVNPGASEAAGDGVDQDCDGTEFCYEDNDDDGYRPDIAQELVSADTDCDDAGEATSGDPLGDCDDVDAAYHPGASESDCTDPSDYNCDGSTGFEDDDADGWAACLECDDADATVNPDGVEAVGDSVDQDCDGTEVCFADTDDDGYRPDDVSTVESADPSCGGASEAVAEDPVGDCDDADANVHPDASEIVGDAFDSDCDGGELCFADGDEDGYRTGDTVASLDSDCDDVGEALNSEADEDCNDADPNFHPGATEEECDGTDDDFNCDGSVADADADADGYPACEDCNDSLASVNPGAVEICNGQDDNCTGTSDEDAIDMQVVYADADGDGYGDPATTSSACGTPDGWVLDATDCDDTSASRHPGAADLPDDGIDQDCDGIDATEGDSGEPRTREGGFFGGCSGAAGTPAAALLGLVALARRRRRTG